MVNSLCSLSWVEKVNFLIDGSEPGEHFLTRGDYQFNNAVINPPSAAKRESRRLAFLYDISRDEIVAIPVKAVYDEGLTIEMAALKAAVDAPSEANLVNILTVADMPESVRTVSGICEIDLPRAFFADREDESQIELAMQIMANAAFEIQDVVGVTFTLEGGPLIYGNLAFNDTYRR
jgi:hypothetical protein